MTQTAANTPEVPVAVPEPAADPRQFVAQVRAANAAFYEDPRGRGALKDLQQTFPNTWLYIAELLQNAIDANANRVSARADQDGSVVFEHNGNAFNHRDVRALCERGVSTKGAATVGFMGVGFKAVFRSFEQVQVSSGGWQFRLQVPVVRGETFGDVQRDWIGAVLPEWDGGAAAPSEGMTCRFHLSGRIAGLPAPQSDFEAVLGTDKSLLPLLAWRGVKEVELGDCGWLLDLRHGSGEQCGGAEVDAVSDGTGPSRRWVVFCSRYTPSREAVARFLEHRQLSPSPAEKEQVYQEASRAREVLAFCPLDDSGAPTPPHHGVAFALLPTAVSLPLGLHIQADWLLVINRQEIMQLDGNAWHGEILAQIPKLLRDYLKWLVSVVPQRSGAWASGYSALPTPIREDIKGDEWVGGAPFVSAARECLREVPFLPVPSGDGDAVTFESPERARHLPAPLAKLMSRERMKQGLLFGGAVVSGRLLGDRANQWLQTIEVLTELSPNELVSDWSSHRVRTWYEAFSPEERAKALAELLEALAELDGRAEWSKCNPVCLPTEVGGWTTRVSVTRLPRDWAVLTNVPAIMMALQPFAGPKEELVSWSFDAWLIQNRPDRQRYLEEVKVWDLDELATAWWDSLPELVSEETAAAVVAFTVWVRRKQSQRKNLVEKVICVKDGAPHFLVSADASVLADPYASSIRRSLYPTLPVISEAYLASDAGSSAADWRAFFESMDDAPSGRFKLAIHGDRCLRSQLESLVGNGFSAPYQRATFMAAKCRGLAFNSHEYLLVDWKLPEPANKLLEGPITSDASHSLSEWLAESCGGWRGMAKKKFAFIPYGHGAVDEREMDLPTSWTQSLANTPWVFSVHGDGPFRPREILSAPDPARPEAPVAALPVQLVQSLADAGVKFGGEIPNAPTIVRLKSIGPTSIGDELATMIVEAIEQAGEDDDQLSLVRAVLDSTPLFPLPPGIVPVDAATRVTRLRLVQSLRGRSALGNWVIAADAYPNGSPEQRMIAAVESTFGLAESPGAEHAMDFLAWVWNTRPEAERVRQLLPRAYQFVLEGIEASPAVGVRWNTIREACEVFLIKERKWTRVVGNERLYFDDVRERFLTEVGLPIELATPGHLGDTEDDQERTAHLVGIRLLSERFHASVVPTGPKETPEAWSIGFRNVQEDLKARLLARKDADEESIENLPHLELSVWDAIHAKVLDGAAEIRSLAVSAASWNAGVAVAGTPPQFGEQLCQSLFSMWGLSARRDLLELLPKVAIQLSSLDRVAAGTTETKEPEDDSSARDGGTEGSGEGSGQEEPEKNAEEAGRTEPKTGTDGPDRGSGGDGKEPATNGSKSDGQKRGGHTSDDREAHLERIRKRIKELRRQESSLLAAEALPENEESTDDEEKGEFRSDNEYRQAAEEFEKAQGRFPDAKPATQEGHDLDSFSHPKDHPERRLVRRIEVKGKGVPWTGDQTVELSDSQFLHAAGQKLANGEAVSADFDYWLYVVERNSTGVLAVLPIRNPARQSAKVEFRGGTWRPLVEPGDA